MAAPSSSSATNTTSTINASVIESNPFGNILDQAFTIKLDKNNFTLWKTMVTTVIKGHKLDGHLLGTKPCPSEMIPVEVANPNEIESGMINPEYERWVARDQLLMGWLYNSMSEGVALSVMGSTTAAELWKSLEDLFGVHSKSRANAIRTSIQTTRKWGSTMEEYLRQIKSWSDTLAISGDPYPQALRFANVLAGLDSEYMSIVVLIESREKLSWQELHDTLLSFDSKLEHINNTSNKGVVPSMPLANIATSRSVHAGTNKPNFQHYQTNNQGGNRVQTRGNYRGGRFRGRGGRSNTGSHTINPRLKPTCQVCGKHGHTAANCFHRFNERYMGASPSGNNSGSHSAFIATLEIIDEGAWYADSGATDHITHDAGQVDRSENTARET